VWSAWRQRQERGGDAQADAPWVADNPHTLEHHFGRYGRRLYELARGIDHNPVVPNRSSKSISAEDTFEIDIPLAETAPLVHKLAEKVRAASRQNARMARTVVLKLKTKEFNTLTRSLTPPVMPTSLEEFASVALSLCERVELGPGQLFRLVGVGLSNFQVEAESNSPLFEDIAIQENDVVSTANELENALNEPGV
jgi:Nucleotidyltransferase/DNA polymerase involved in DNA repair